MKKVELERLLKGFDDALIIGLDRIRQEGDGLYRLHAECLSCGVAAGEQHQARCAMWPLILARAALRLAEETD